MMSKREQLGLLLGIIGIAVFAGSLPGTRLALTGLDPWFVTAARAGIAGLCALALLVALRRKPPGRASWGRIGIAAFGLVLGFPLFSALAMQSVPAAHGGVVLGILPLATAGAAVLMTHERPGTGFWIAALVGAALVIVYAIQNGGGGSFALGDGFLLLAIVSAGAGYTASGDLTRRMPGWEVISWTLVLSLPFSLAAMIALWPANPAAVPLAPWLALAYVALMPQWLGFFAWNAGLALGGISRVSQVQLLQPFITVALAALVNRETIEAQTLLFAAAVVVTVGIGTRMRVESP